MTFSSSLELGQRYVAPTDPEIPRCLSFTDKLGNSEIKISCLGDDCKSSGSLLGCWFKVKRGQGGRGVVGAGQVRQQAVESSRANRAAQKDRPDGGHYLAKVERRNGDTAQRHTPLHMGRAQ